MRNYLDKSLTKEDIARVQATWHTLKLLLADQQTNEQKFLQLMDATVNGLEHADVMMSAVRELGIRHPLFGDSDEHHGTIATALFWSLEKCLRKDFTEEVRAAWTSTYDACRILKSLSPLKPLFARA